MLHYFDETKDHGIYYDQIRLNFSITVNELRKFLYPINDLIIEESSYFHVSKASDVAQQFGLYAKIELVAPSRKCLEIIDKNIPHSIRMKISKLEIARDTFFETEREAQSALYKLIRTIRKKYTSKHLIYDPSREGERKKRKKKSKINKSHFSQITGYFGIDNFEYVIYARLSKINNRPCIHAEWRILGASLIKRKTGIVSIGDLITFNLPKFYDELQTRFIVYERIDLTKLGRWLLGWTRKKSFSERASRKMGIMGRLFCNVYKIKTYADLVSHLSNVKIKLKQMRGPKNRYQEKFLSLTDYARFRDDI